MTGAFVSELAQGAKLQLSPGQGESKWQSLVGECGQMGRRVLRHLLSRTRIGTETHFWESLLFLLLQRGKS